MADLDPLTEASIDFRKTQSPDYQLGYDRGWEDAYRELSERDEHAVPPWFRRFFWYPRESFDSDWRPLMISTGHDEYCNPVLGIRVWGGVLNIRHGWKVRMPKDGPCRKCAIELGGL